MSNSDCQPDGGPGHNLCSLAGGFIDFYAVASFVDLGAVIYPSPVCLLPSCEAGTDGVVHFCDGPDQATSPGVCVTGVTGTGNGCYPACFFDNAGSAPVGCLANDVCVSYGVVEDATGNLRGVGYCTGGCTSDAQCPSNQQCQTDWGACVTMKIPPTKAIGAACTNSDNGEFTNPSNCFCNVAPTMTDGYCSQFCIVGSTTAPCPTGYTCDGQEPLDVVNANDAGITGFSKQNTGLAGVCTPTCSIQGSDAGE